jgi:putative heme-binding domain-containing protein
MLTSPPRPGTLFFLFAQLLSVLPWVAAAARDEFAEHVRTTPPLAAAEQLATFRLPPGFAIELVASEPEIQKPMNLAFDARGRLWVSGSTEYPYAAPLDRPGRDSIRILEDFDANGRARKVSVFADGLNIPIGLYPFRDGVIAFSIPNIYLLEDTDGDGKADRREVLYGPLGYERDTHGLNNAFRRGFDGWLYACHGFNNSSTFRGRDGHEITLISGNTYRVRLDGSRVEQFTWGQVNPFGMAIDPLGNRFSADCHSRPIYQLLRGGRYPTFGAPGDGLGLVPAMMEHHHGSTALAGVAIYAAEEFPEEYRGNFFTGNVMTSRVNRNRAVYHGATVKAKEEPDFVVTSDPWFRPVDLQVGPDGALYIADFYNRIIGHYEVPLDHPGRDRERGRIWRVLYRGEGAVPSSRPADLSRASAAELIAALRAPNLTSRLLATDQLTDRIGAEAVEPLRQALAEDPSPWVKAHALRALERLDALTPEALAAAAESPQREVRVHALQALAGMRSWSASLEALAAAALEDRDAFVRLAAVEALAAHPQDERLRGLLDLLAATPAEDGILRHGARMAIRDLLRDEERLARLRREPLEEADERVIAGLVVSVASPEAGSFLLRFLRRHAADRNVTGQYLRHAARHLPRAEIGSLVALAREKLAADLDLQWTLLDAAWKGLEQRGLDGGDHLRDWGEELAARLLASAAPGALEWISLPLEDAAPGPNPWVLRSVPCADGRGDAPFFHSLPRGEQLTGVLRSRDFEIPAKLSFFLAGHVGPPGEPVVARNFVRLRAAGSAEVLAESRPPRNDTAQQVTWSLEAHAGKRGFIEIVDGDDRGAYAWLAAGRFSPPVPPMPGADPSLLGSRLEAAAEIVARFRIDALESEIARVLESSATEPAARAAAARALSTLHPSPEASALAVLAGEPGLPASLRERIAGALAGRLPAATGEALEEIMASAPSRLQASAAQTLAGSPSGAERLLEMAERGRISARLLLRRSIREKLKALKLDGIDERLERLSASLPPESAEIEQLIESRRKAHGAAQASALRGAEVFAANCAACHQIGGKGALVGPQLDGIGARGLERLLEDVLDTNRNVDVAFRSTTYVLEDGSIVTGLFRREEGETLVIADGKGQEISLKLKDIVEQVKTLTSPMPENFGEVLSPEDFHHLMAFLLAQRAP